MTGVQKGKMKYDDDEMKLEEQKRPKRLLREGVTASDSDFCLELQDLVRKKGAWNEISEIEVETSRFFMQLCWTPDIEIQVIDLHLDHLPDVITAESMRERQLHWETSWPPYRFPYEHESDILVAADIRASHSHSHRAAAKFNIGHTVLQYYAPYPMQLKLDDAAWYITELMSPAVWDTRPYAGVEILGYFYYGHCYGGTLQYVPEIYLKSLPAEFLDKQIFATGSGRLKKEFQSQVGEPEPDALYLTRKGEEAEEVPERREECPKRKARPKSGRSRARIAKMWHNKEAERQRAAGHMDGQPICRCDDDRRCCMPCTIKLMQAARDALTLDDEDQDLRTMDTDAARSALSRAQLREEEALQTLALANQVVAKALAETGRCAANLAVLLEANAEAYRNSSECVELLEPCL